MDTVYTQAAPPVRPPRRRRRWPLRLAIVLIVLVGLAIGADRIAASVAGSVAAQSIQNSQNLRDKPSVTIHGFPFLTQLASHHFDDVDLTAHDVPVGSGPSLTISDVHVNLRDITTTGNFDTIHAATASAQAHVDYAELSDALGATASYAGGGRLKVGGSVSVLGLKVSGYVSAAVEVSQGTGIEFTDPKVQVLGQDSGAVDDALGALVEHPISLAGLPFDVSVTGATVDASGVTITLAGRDLTYSKS